jgi:ribose transport system permease protein
MQEPKDLEVESDPTASPSLERAIHSPGATAASVEGNHPRDWRRFLLLGMAKYGTIIALVAMIVVFSIARTSTFATTANVVAILSAVAITAIVSAGLTIALAAGVFDLSIGYVASFAGVLVTGLMSMQHYSVPVAILITLGVCGVIGFINGILVTKANISSFIATLGTGTVVVGLNYLYNSGGEVAQGIPNSFTAISLNKLLGVPLPVFIVGAAMLGLWVVLNRTVLGENVQAVGGNRVAARLAGVPVDRVQIYALVICAICAGAGGILLAAELGSGAPTAGDGYLLTAFAAAFLGSVALRDGEFHIVGTVVGVLIVGVGFNGLTIVGVSTYFEYVFNGGLLIVAVAGSTLARRFAGA